MPASGQSAPGLTGEGRLRVWSRTAPLKGSSKAGKGTREHVLPRFSCHICHTDRETEGQRGHVCWTVTSSEAFADHPAPVTSP